MAEKRGEKKSEALGISGFTLGIVSLALVFSPFYGVLASVVGFIFCVAQQKKAPTKFGKIGIILNIIGFILNVVVFYVLLSSLMGYLNSFPELGV